MVRFCVSIKDEKIRHSDLLQPGTDLIAKRLATLNFTAVRCFTNEKSGEGAFLGIAATSS